MELISADEANNLTIQVNKNNLQDLKKRIANLIFEAIERGSFSITYSNSYIPKLYLVKQFLEPLGYECHVYDTASHIDITWQK